MKFLEGPLKGLWIMEPRIFRDDRGYFLETFRQKVFEQGTGIQEQFVQDNLSRSKKGILRGMHYQLAPHAMGKLVRCIRGSIFDVAIDLRRDSSTFGKWHGLILSDENGLGFYVPPGFAHGFIVLSETADVSYKCTTYYEQSADRSVLWNDPKIGIRWPIQPDTALLTEKDRNAPPLSKAEINF